MDCWFNLLANSALGLLDQSLLSVDHKSMVLKKKLNPSNLPIVATVYSIKHSLNFDIILGLENE